MCVCVCVCVCVSHSVLSDSLWSYEVAPPGSYVHEISQARTLEQAAILFSKGSSQPKDWTHVSIPYISCFEGRFFTIWATREAQEQVLEVIKRE